MIARDASIADFTDVSFRFPNTTMDALRRENWSIERGSFSLVIGPSGSGKSSLLRCLNGLVPHFTGGGFGGNVIVSGRNTRTSGPRDMSDLVGFVFQDPESQLIADRVEDEIAFGLEHHGVDRLTMRKRVEEALDYLGIQELRHRRPRELSGGEQQRVAVASALAMHPGLLVLDEPTSQLDPWGAEEVLSALTRLNEDLGLTIVVAEHRLERLLSRADIVRVMGNLDRGPITGAPGDVVQQMDPVPLPPVTQLGWALGVDPAPLTVKDARRVFRDHPMPSRLRETSTFVPGDTVAALDGIRVVLSGREVLGDLSMTIRQGELVALMGRNGSGKTTILRTIAGLQQVANGNVTTCGLDMRKSNPVELGGAVGYVPQHASTLFFKERLIDELAYTARIRGHADKVGPTLDRFGLRAHAESHPLDLSGGERERAALATVMIGQPTLLLLDEPTRGMDAWKKIELASNLKKLQATGVAIVMVTHDVELVAQCASRVVMLADKQVIADGTPREVLSGSLTYTTQINKVFGGQWLTVEDVVTAIANAPQRLC